jgi:hypothetical protein
MPQVLGFDLSEPKTLFGECLKLGEIPAGTIFEVPIRADADKGTRVHGRAHGMTPKQGFRESRRQRRRCGMRAPRYLDDTFLNRLTT